MKKSYKYISLFLILFLIPSSIFAAPEGYGLGSQDFKLGENSSKEEKSYEGYKEYKVGSSLSHVQTLKNTSYKETTKISKSFYDTSQAAAIRQKYLSVVKDYAVEMLGGNDVRALSPVVNNTNPTNITSSYNSNNRTLLPRPKDKADVLVHGTIKGTMADKEAVVKMAKSYMGKLTYSQGKRTQSAYADCSSFIYRMYFEATGIILGSKDWPPVCSWYASNFVHIQESELQPGDIIVGIAGPHDGHVVMYENEDYVVHMTIAPWNCCESKIKKNVSDLGKKYNVNTGSKVSFLRIIEATS